MPAAGIMTSIKNNMSVINAGFILTGGTAIGQKSYLWSSSEAQNDLAWSSYFNFPLGLGDCYFDYSHGSKTNRFDVRPVLEF